MTNLLGEGIFNLAVILSLAVILKREREREGREKGRERWVLCFTYLCNHWLIAVCVLTRD